MVIVMIESIRDEFRRYQSLAERALEQVADEALSAPGPGDGNSLATIAWHIGGNLRSRFTGFLDEDGEKPWRDREGEFARRQVSREALMAQWQVGWSALFAAIDPLTDADLTRTITIRRQPMTVHEALHRSLAHISYHVGQIVYVAHVHRGSGWQYLSIPPGGSAAYNAAPTGETARAHTARLRQKPDA